MKQSLDLTGAISEDTLKLSWNKPVNYSSFNVKIGNELNIHEHWLVHISLYLKIVAMPKWTAIE